jgi:peptidoglycan hydrolase-like protein with peptidoglycan-binding domain
VLALQKYLNAHGYTVATSGPGSVGNETTTFGPATKAALIKFQKANNITPASGYFGPLTRAAIATTH